MVRWNFLILVAGLALSLVGCSGDGLRAKVSDAIEDNIENSLGTEGPGGDVVGGGDGSGNPPPVVVNPPSSPNPPVGPQPGDFVQDSPRDPRAEYPPVGTPAPEVEIPAEPNSDFFPPVISIIEKPDPIIPSNDAEVEVWVADNVNGRGIEKTECKLNDGSFAECDTKYVLEDLPDGIHTVVSRTTDRDNNVSGEVSYTFMVDTQPPAVALTQTPEALTGENSAEFLFEGNDATSGVEEYFCSLDGQTPVSCSGPQQLDSLSDGRHSFEVIAVDRAGHKSPVANFVWEVDTSIPTVRIVAAPAALSASAQARFEFVGQATGGQIERFECQLDGGLFEECSSPHVYSALNEGTHNFSVRAYTEVGRVSAEAKHQWLVDTVPPVVQWVATPTNPNSSPASEFQFSGTDSGSGLARLECRRDGGSISPCSSPISLALADGQYQFEVRAVDQVGNLSNWISYQWLVDQTAPVVQITQSPESLTAESAASLAFSVVESGSGVDRIECDLNGAGYTPCSSPTTYNVAEGEQNFSVRAIDRAGNTSAVVQAWWVVDQTGPSISFVRQPQDIVFIGEDAQIQFLADDPSGLSSVECFLDGQSRPCENNVLFTEASSIERKVVLSVAATDTLGNATVVNIQWDFQFNYVAQSTEVTVSPDRPVDVLFVVDNSGSMDDERANLAQRIDGFIERIDGLDWQISVISTDVTSSQNAQGNFVELIGMPGEYILDASMDVQLAQTVFGNTVQGFGNGSPDEMGIYATKLSIDRYLAGQTEHTQFYREEADLSVIVLSDEDENSDGNDVAISPEDMITFVQDSFGPEKNFTWHSMVTMTGDADCLSQQSFAHEGRTYEELSRLTGHGEVGGAIIGSVCDPDYTAQLADIGQSVKDRQNTIQLNCTPADQDGDGTGDILVNFTPDGQSVAQPFTKAYTLQGTALIYSELLLPGQYEVEYSCIE